jgi:Rrf2 family protein
MISLTGEYALRAMVFLARHRDEWPIAGPRIASEAGIPRKYLSAILADLVRAGLLEGTRGKSGGFRMTRSAKEIRLAEVVHPFEPVNFNRQSCPFGNAVCSDADPCGAHERWKGLKAALDEFLAETTLQNVATKRAERGSRDGRSRSSR